MRQEFDRPSFIRRHTRLMPVPLVPEISLYMADDATELWQHTEADLDVVGLPPPFWAFAWREAKPWRAIFSIVRNLCRAPACSISPAGPGWSPSRR